MTPDRTVFVKYNVLSTEQFVTAVNGLTLPGIGWGRVRISVSVNKYTKSIVLTDILYVSQIKGNLISIVQLQNKGIIVETTALPEKTVMIIKY
jgi:Pol polyprotein, beta-barrel domain